MFVYVLKLKINIYLFYRRAMLMSRVIKGEFDSASSAQLTSSENSEDIWQICMRDKVIICYMYTKKATQI